MTDCPEKKWKGEEEGEFGRPVEDQPRNAGLKKGGKRKAWRSEEWAGMTDCPGPSGRGWRKGNF